MKRPAEECIIPEEAKKAKRKKVELGPPLNSATLVESLSSVGSNDSSSHQKLIPNSVMTRLQELSYGC